MENLLELDDGKHRIDNGILLYGRLYEGNTDILFCFHKGAEVTIAGQKVKMAFIHFLGGQAERYCVFYVPHTSGKWPYPYPPELHFHSLTDREIVSFPEGGTLAVGKYTPSKTESGVQGKHILLNFSINESSELRKYIETTLSTLELPYLYLDSVIDPIYKKIPLPK